MKRACRDRRARRIAAGMVLALAAVLAACTTPAPVHYYTLVAPAKPPAVVAAGFDIDVLPVVVTPGLRRRAMVLRTGPARLMVQDGHQWQAPLPDELRAALSTDLVATLGTRDLAGLQPVAGRPLYRVALVVQRFDAVYGTGVDVSAAWSIYSVDDTPLLTCASRAARDARPGYAELVEGAQQALAAIAAQIGAALKALPRAACPT